MKITVEAVLGLMPIVAAQGWRERAFGNLRNVNGECPVVALFKELVGVGDDGNSLSFIEYFPQFGIKERNDHAFWEVASASDHTRGKYRIALEQALGLRG